MCPKPTKLLVHLLCSTYSIKELPEPSVQGRAVVLNKLSLCISAACTSESPESCLLRSLAPLTYMGTAGFLVHGFE